MSMKSVCSRQSRLEERRASTQTCPGSYMWNLRSMCMHSAHSKNRPWAEIEGRSAFFFGWTHHAHGPDLWMLSLAFISPDFSSATVTRCNSMLRVANIYRINAEHCMGAVSCVVMCSNQTLPSAQSDTCMCVCCVCARQEPNPTKVG